MYLYCGGRGIHISTMAAPATAFELYTAECLIKLIKIKNLTPVLKEAEEAVSEQCTCMLVQYYHHY